MITDFFTKLYEMHDSVNDDEKAIIEQISELALYFLDFPTDYDSDYCMMIDTAMRERYVIHDVK